MCCVAFTNAQTSGVKPGFSVSYRVIFVLYKRIFYRESLKQSQHKHGYDSLG